MKKLIVTFILMSVAYFTLYAQITITKNDMPSVGDTIHLNTTLFAVGINYQQAGNNITWDFSNINGTPAADTFVAVTSTPLVYQAAFLLSLTPANLAQPMTDVNFIPGFQLTDMYNFYRSTTASYVQQGYGARIAGIPLPFKFNAPDVWYKFPLSINSPADSSQATFSAGLPGIGYLGIDRKRVNYVDGWGTLISPFGTFQTLRVKSEVIEIDSIYIDSLNFGIPITRNYTEYKWLGHGYGIPLFQVTQEGLLTTFRWIDDATGGNPLSVSVSANPGTTICDGGSVTLTANATGGTPPYTYIWSNFSFGQSITVNPSSTTTYNVTITDSNFNFANSSITINVGTTPVFFITASDTLLCSAPVPQQLTLSVPSGYANYSWSTGAGGANATQVITGPPSPGYTGYYPYSVTITSSDGCPGYDTVLVHWMICSGIDELSQIKCMVSPNPASGIINLNLENGQSSLVEIALHDNIGRKVASLFSNRLSAGKHLLSFRLDKFSIPNGLYILKIMTPASVISEKLIIQ